MLTFTGFIADDFSIEKILQDADIGLGEDALKDIGLGKKELEEFDDTDLGNESVDKDGLPVLDQPDDFFMALGEGDDGNEGFADFDNFESKLKQSNSQGSEGVVSDEDEEGLEELPPFNPVWDSTQGWHFLLRQPLKKKFTQNR